MKHFLLLSMIVCNACYGQDGRRIDSLLKVMQDSGWATMTTQDTFDLLEDGWKKGQLYSTVDTVSDRSDTVLVYVTCIDTTHEYLLPSILDSVSLSSEDSSLIYWVKGRQVKPYDLGVKDKMEIFAMKLYIIRSRWGELLGYLDQYKHPLSKNIVVWQSIEVNNKK